ncbi:MAG TPA: hypothetical protein VFC82_08920 [Actinomycetaceae bacterium]|nr:hypothetical protein [Actinomycetaceae bacterium]
MILYDLACRGGHRFEAALSSMDAPNPDCECGEPTRRLISRLNIGGRAAVGPSREDMPTTWRGLDDGDAATVRHWHSAMSKREELEEKHPELAGDRRPVLAHEGVFANAPLRAGDDLVGDVVRATFGAKKTTTSARRETAATKHEPAGERPEKDAT